MNANNVNNYILMDTVNNCIVNDFSTYFQGPPPVKLFTCWKDAEQFALQDRMMEYAIIPLTFVITQ